MSSFKDFFIKKLYEKLNEEKANSFTLNPNKSLYELLYELAKRESPKNENLNGKIKQLELKLTKLLAYSLIRYKTKKISKYFNMGLSNPSFLEILFSTESKFFKKISEKLSLIVITGEEGIPIVTGEEGIKYGPFKKGDIVFISESFSSLLIKKKLARLMKSEST